MKSRTTINISDDLVHAVRMSGVNNFSGYLERLIKRDLASLNEMGEREAKKVQTLREELDEVREEWEEYLKNSKDSAQSR